MKYLVPSRNKVRNSFRQAKEGRGAESIFLSKYLNPNCVGDNTVHVL